MIMSFRHRFLGLSGSLFLLAGAAPGPLRAAPLEFDTGHPQPAVEGQAALAAGLALSRGYVRGVPMGELAGWTASLWFKGADEVDGTIFGVVIDDRAGTSMQLRWHEGELRLAGPAGNEPNGWKFETEVENPGSWHHVAITYVDEGGLAFYLDGSLVGSGERAWLGYATSFQHYYFGASPGEGDGGEAEPSDFFGGLIDDFKLFSRPFETGEIERLARGKSFEDSLIAFQDFENVDHRDLARFVSGDRDESYLEKGRKLYEQHCVACHSKDGVSPSPNPLARNFTKHAMDNGGDPYSMFRTVTYGFRNMMAAPQLSPVERYQVIHYIREELIRPNAPELYVPVDESYTAAMPSNPEELREEAERFDQLAGVGYLRDYGGALINPVRGPEGMLSRNALVLDLGDKTTLGYDLGTMRSIGAWTGGFLDFRNTLHHKLRAAGLPRARFDFFGGFDESRWAWDGRAENAPPKLPEHKTWPESQVRYRGHYAHGDETVISYAVQGRGVLESPLASGGRKDSEPVIHRRFQVAPGKRAIELIVASGGDSAPRIEGRKAVIEEDGEAKRVFWLQSGETAGASWRVGGSNQLVLHFGAAENPLRATLVHAGAQDPEPARRDADFDRLTGGGPSRWTVEHTLKGSLAVSEFQDYVLDSLPVPLKNAYNTWMRTASLAFFPDGRLAVGTLSGDIWIVDGIDDDLGAVTWRRFAAGLYEPLGMKVIDGVLTATTRGRIVKLHDLNDDGEADYYEAFFNEDHPAPGWHAYNFDLEVDEDGYLYYARVGGFSDWTVPGGLVRVSPDGSDSEVLGAGMRVPNGIGLLPDGRITYGDNQGNWVPASKIAIASEPGSFLGAGSWRDSDADYDPESRVRPIVHMPQELDSSSGGQLWVGEDPRFGPLSGAFFHTSYGRARTMIVMLDEFDDVSQGAVYPLPLAMESGTMRVAKNPRDGQLYYSGMTGWQSGATREGSVQRLRFTGEGGGEGLYLMDARAREGRLELEFNRPLDPAELEEFGDWRAEAWNYRYSKRYGSPHYKVTEPDTEGSDIFAIEALALGDGGRKLGVRIPELRPCHTLRLNFSVSGKESGALEGPLYFTIHELPE
jgi:mono/diheme cytochrome c family protein